MVSRPSLKEACDLPKAQGAVVIKHDDVTGSAAASNLELYPEKHGSSCCIHKRYNVTSQHSRAEFPQGFWLWQWLNISTTGFCFKTLFCFSRDRHPRLLMSAVIRNCLNL